MVRSLVTRPHSAARELAALAALYGVYEVVRGLGGGDYDAAFAHTDEIVALERRLHVFVEGAVQDGAAAVPGLPTLLGVAYVLLHFAGTAAAIVWVYRRRRERFALVRTTFVASTALALVGYVLYPAAPPRLAGLGFDDTVTAKTGLDLSSDLLGSLYNPIAAVPSLHFGYAVIVGATLAVLAASRAWRVAGAAYPAVMLGIVVATGNHFFFDAAAGGVVVLAGWLVARGLLAPVPVRSRVRQPAPQHT